MARGLGSRRPRPAVVARELQQVLGRAFRRRWYVGLRAALSVGIPLLAGVAAGRPSWGALASIGSLAGFYGPDTPYRYRFRLTAGVGVALAVVVPLGSLCASRAWLSIAFVGVVACVASFACTAGRVPPPRDYLIVLGALAATGVPTGLPGAARECALVAGGALTGVAVTMAPSLARRAVPQTRAVSQAWAAVREVLRTAGTPAAARGRERAVAAFADARAVERQAGLGADDSLMRSLSAAEMVLASALSVSIEARAPLDPGCAEAICRLGLLSSDSAPAQDPANPAEAVTAEAGRPSVTERLQEALSPQGVVLPAAVRIGVAVAAGAGLGRILGLNHSYWVGLTAAAALQASNITLLFRRSLYRLVGTAVGVTLAWVIFAVHPAVVIVAVVAVLAQFIAEVTIRASYGLAVIFVTILALSIYDLAVPGTQIGVAVGARLVDTAIGAGVVVVLRLALWPRATVARIPQAQARILDVIAVVFRDRWLSGPHPGPPAAQRLLQELLVQLRAMDEDARGDHVIGSSSGQRDQVTLAIDELAMLALGVPFDRPPPPRHFAEALVSRLEQCAAILRAGPPPAGTPLAGNRVVELPGYPRTQAATALLTSAFLQPDHRSAE